MIDDGSKIRIKKDTKMLLKLTSFCAAFVLSIGAIIALIIIMGMDVISPLIGIPGIAICAGITFVAYTCIREIYNKWEAHKRKVQREKLDARKAQHDREYRKYILEHNLDSVSGTEYAVYLDGKWVSPEEAYKHDVANAVRKLIATLDRYTDISESIGYIEVYDDEVCEAINCISEEVEKAIGSAQGVDDDDASIVARRMQAMEAAIFEVKSRDEEKVSRDKNMILSWSENFNKRMENTAALSKELRKMSGKNVSEKEANFLSAVRGEKKPVDNASDSISDTQVVDVDFAINEGRFFASKTGDEAGIVDIAKQIDEAGGVSIMFEDDSVVRVGDDYNDLGIVPPRKKRKKKGKGKK